MELGQTVMTRGIAEEMKKSFYFRVFISDAFIRYENEDWGEMCKEDLQENDRALQAGDRVFASYSMPAYLRHEVLRDKVWIITEADRSYTTVLFPEEY